MGSGPARKAASTNLCVLETDKNAVESMLSRGTCANDAHGGDDTVESIAGDHLQSRQLIWLGRLREVVDLEDRGLCDDDIEDVGSHKVASDDALDASRRKDLLGEGVH